MSSVTAGRSPVVITGSLTDLVASVSQEDARKIREEARRTEMSVAKHTRAALGLSHQHRELTTTTATMMGSSGSSRHLMGSSSATTNNSASSSTPPLPPIARSPSQNRLGGSVNASLVPQHATTITTSTSTSTSNSNNGANSAASPSSSTRQRTSSTHSTTSRDRSRPPPIAPPTPINGVTNGPSTATANNTPSHSLSDLPYVTLTPGPARRSPSGLGLSLADESGSMSLGSRSLNTSVTRMYVTRGGVRSSYAPAGYSCHHNWIVSDEALNKIYSKKKSISPFVPDKYYAMLPAVLPHKKDKILLCLDIDETLLHSTLVMPNSPQMHEIFDHRLPISGNNGSTALVCVDLRPKVKEFLQMIEPMFEIAIFTASQSAYANMVLDLVDPDKKLGTQRLYREHCAEVNGQRVKDLTLLGRPLDRVCILDNSPIAYMFQPRNAIPILSYFKGENDNELMKLMPMLEILAKCNSVYDVLDPFNAFLITPEPTELQNMDSPMSGTPRSQSIISYHSPLASHVPSQRNFGASSSLTNNNSTVPYTNVANGVVGGGGGGGGGSSSAPSPIMPAVPRKDSSLGQDSPSVNGSPLSRPPLGKQSFVKKLNEVITNSSSEGNAPTVGTSHTDTAPSSNGSTQQYSNSTTVGSSNGQQYAQPSSTVSGGGSKFTLSLQRMSGGSCTVGSPGGISSSLSSSITTATSANGLSVNSSSYASTPASQDHSTM